MLLLNAPLKAYFPTSITHHPYNRYLWTFGPTPADHAAAAAAHAAAAARAAAAHHAAAAHDVAAHSDAM